MPTCTFPPKNHSLRKAQWSTKDANKKLLVRKKTIRVLLDTGSSGELLFMEKRVY
jgi:hypothetical protein